jgi:hypothetical protein
LNIERSILAYRFAWKELLEIIPVTDDAMDRRIMELEIEVQQLCEEQFRGLKV